MLNEAPLIRGASIFILNYYTIIRYTPTPLPLFSNPPLGLSQILLFIILIR